MAAIEIDVRRVAQLARLSLSPEEEQRYAAQLGQVLEHVAKLGELDVSNIEPTAHAVPLSNVLRSDELREGLAREEALMNAPDAADGLFRVPRIVE